MVIHGQWFFPDLDNKFYFGNLHIDDDKIKLNIFGELPNVKMPIRFPIIYGKSIEGDFTLINAVWNRNLRANYTNNSVETGLFVSEVIRGHCYEKSEGVKFRKYSFELDGLKEWIKDLGIDVRDSNGQIKVEYLRPKTINFDIQNFGSGKIIFEESTCYDKEDYDTICQITQFVSILLETPDELKYDSFITIALKLRALFFLLFGKNPTLIRQLFSSKEHEELIYFTNSRLIIHNFNEFSRFSVLFEDIKCNFESTLNSFLSKADQLEPILNIWMNFLTDDKLKDENKFLLVCQALEAFHRKFMEQNETYVNSESKTYGGSKSPYFKTRIKRIINLLEQSLQINITFGLDKESISEQITNTRDYYTHYLKEEKQRFSSQEILAFTPKLIKILHILILKEVGVNETVLKKYFESTSFDNYYDVKNIPKFRKS